MQLEVQNDSQSCLESVEYRPKYSDTVGHHQAAKYSHQTGGILVFLFMACNWMPFGFGNDLGVTGNTNGSFSEQIINIESFGKT